MGKVSEGKHIEGTEKSSKRKKQMKKAKSSNNGEISHFKPQQQLCKKKYIVDIIKNEYKFISSLFEILDLSILNQGRRNESDEDENSDTMQVADVPEQKVFKKQTQKKVNVKKKSFPHTIEGLEKELAELKGTQTSYQMKLRKKGLRARLLKKKRREQIKLRKTATQHNAPGNGLSKTKPILNSDGNIVSNKFDFADADLKKDTKKKLGAVNSEINIRQSVNLPNGLLNKNDSSKENFQCNGKSDLNRNNSLTKSPAKKENNVLANTKAVSNSDGKSSNKPVFNKENKMVFSKVYLPEINKKVNKKESKNKNPKIILEKLKEESKKISKLEKEDREKAVSLKEKQKWATALKRASGEKVKDDPELLRKSIAREKNKKMRSQKKWKSRIDHVEKEKEEKQKKRKENIQARKTEKKKKKMKRAIKKGSFVPL